MSDLDLLLQSVAALHDTCFDDAQWTSALASVGKLLRSFTVTIALESRELEFPFVQSDGLSPEAIRDYAVEYSRIDPVIAYARKVPAGIACTDLMAMDEAAFARTRFAHEFAHRYGMRPCVQAFTDRSEALSGFLCAARSGSERPYSEADRGLTQALLPHLRQVLRIRCHLRQLEGQRLTVFDMLDRIDHAAILVDAQFRVVFANREGERLLGAKCGLKTAGGRLVATTVADTDRLRRAISHAITYPLACDPVPTAVKRLPPARPLMARIVPLRARTVDGITTARDLAFILVGDPDRRTPGADLDVGRVFDLTPAEANVVSLLAAGQTPKAIAAAMHVSITTVRTHLAHIFDKSGTRRQIELMATIHQYRI